MTYHRRTFLLGLGSLPFASYAQADLDASATKLINTARAQIGITTGYDGAYRSLTYPNGDVARATGVCTDVIIRAYRDAFDFDLQSAVNQDMRTNFSDYPKIWGLSRPDSNIDHRRVPNLEIFLKRKGAHLAMPDNIRELTAGDLLTFRLPGNLPHIALISDRTTPQGLPKIIHNIGQGAQEDPLSADLQALMRRRYRFLHGL